MRLQRFLAQAGVASRRKAEELIAAGRVQVNGSVVRQLGTKVDPGRDRVTVDGRALAAERHAYLLLNKPRGYVTTVRDPEGRPTVMDLVAARTTARVYPVGRLDYGTEGLLVLTNDGDLANALMHPRRGVPKTYRVKLQGLVGAPLLARLRSGVILDDGHRTAPAEVVPLGETGKNSWIELTVHEGRNRQIHRMAEALGLSVLKLQRVRYGPLKVGGMALGDVRALAPREVAALREAAGLPLEQPVASRPSGPRPRPGRRR
jgi:pseudouridine synthase